MVEAKWQREADLLAEGREWIERRSDGTRFRHLYPEGPNLAIVLEAYRDLDRWRVTRDVDPASGRSAARRDRRRFRRLVDRRLRQDALERSRRVTHKIPLPRVHELGASVPKVVIDALEGVDDDTRSEVLIALHGRPLEVDPHEAGRTRAAMSAVIARQGRGLAQFQKGLINRALAEPPSILSLHHQHISFCASPQPTKRRHPIATLLLVKLPVRVMLAMLLLLNLGYLGAYFFFNDEVLGRFVGNQVSGVLDGGLEFDSIHWSPRLALDFALGKPHMFEVEGVRVYEAYKSKGTGPQTETAYLEQGEVGLVLHEIIPWNRLGVPAPLEIPWILHFDGVRNSGEMWIAAKQTPDPETGELTIGLVDAFEPWNLPPPEEGLKTLSIELEDLALEDARVVLDFRPSGDWGVDLTFDELEGQLSYEGSFPEDPPEQYLPFRWRATGVGGDGSIVILGNELDARDMALDDLAMGRAPAGLGDIYIRGNGVLNEAPTTFEGFLRDLLMAPDHPDPPPTSVRIAVGTTDLHPLAMPFLGIEEDDPRPLIVAHDSPATLDIEGPITDPTLSAAAQGITLNIFEQPAWAVDDVDVALSLSRDPLPDLWRELRPELFSESGKGEQRWMVRLDTVRGAALGGDVRLHGTENDHLVLPDDGEPWLISLFVDLDEIDPAILFPDDAATQTLLGGTASGGVEVHRLVVEDELSLLEVFLHGLEIRRNNGPTEDGLPRRIDAEGDIVYAPDEGLDLRGLEVATDGGRVFASGGLEADFKTLRRTGVDIRIEDGASFSRALGVTPYFSRLVSDFTLTGPMMGPSSDRGSLTVLGPLDGILAGSELRNAKLWFERGTMHLRADDARALGGNGPLAVDLQLFENGALSGDPKIRVSLDLEDMDRRNIGGAPIDASGAQVRFYLDNGDSKPVRISKLQARGAAYAEKLVIAGTTFYDAETTFHLSRSRIAFDSLRLTHRRAISPIHGPAVTVETGSVNATGELIFAKTPELDLDVTADHLPLHLFLDALEIDAPVQGQVAPGTRVQLTGPLRRPGVEGKVVLDSLSAAGIPLGRGEIELMTDDQPQQGSLLGHRSVRLHGLFSGDVPNGKKRGSKGGGRDRIDWSADAVVALPDKAAIRKGAEVQAEVDISFAELPLSAILAHPDRWSIRDAVDGALQGASLRALSCPGRAPLLSSCLDGLGDAADDVGAQSLAVRVELDKMWLRPASGRESASPCSERDSLCSEGTLVAEIFDGNRLVLSQPLKLRSGGLRGAELILDGDFDLEAPPPVQETPVCEGDRVASPPPKGRGDATLNGELDLAGLQAVFAAFDLETPTGRLIADLELMGLARTPTIVGSVSQSPDDPITLSLGEDDPESGRKAIPIALSTFALETDASRIFVDAAVKVFGQELRIGPGDGERSQLVVSGPCQGHYAVWVEGLVSSKLFEALAGEALQSSGGSVALQRLHAAGDVASISGDNGPRFQALDGRLSFDRTPLALSTGLDTYRLEGGIIEARQCNGRNCPGQPEGAISIEFGGRQAAGAGSQPRTAVRAKVGDRGSGAMWGVVTLGADLETLESIALRASATQFPLHLSDNAGNPELEASLTISDLALQSDGAGGIAARGAVLVEESRWLRDAQQGVSILSFEDPVPAAPNPLPAFLRDLELDISLQTGSPFEVDINVIKDMEASAELMLQGRLESPELTGVINIDRGLLDISILGEPYEIDRGRVVLERELLNSTVDMVATRTEPVNVDNQLLYLALRVFGTLREISWECQAQGDISGELGNTRECLEYVLFDAGNTEVSREDVRQSGGGGVLYGRPLTLVGNLTQLKINDYLEEEIPRVEGYLPELRLRVGSLGLETDIASRPEWLEWGWGKLGFDFNYLRGYPGGLIRDRRSLVGRFDILENTSIEASFGRRSYSSRILVFDPTEYSALDFVQTWRIPTPR